MGRGSDPILPGTGRGTKRSMVEGACRKVGPVWRPPSVSAGALPPPRTGED